jgi:hypothetical protein
MENVKRESNENCKELAGGSDSEPSLTVGPLPHVHRLVTLRFEDVTFCDIPNSSPISSSYLKLYDFFVRHLLGVTPPLWNQMKSETMAGR